ncbi:5-formyltetrahydrofolate cyclo-ligase [Candidatus Latescibacterota bacterium]
MNLSEAKKTIRARMKKLRDGLDLFEYRKLSTAIMEQCVTLPEWKQASTIHIYVSAVNNEVDTLGLIFGMLDGGKVVVVPKCVEELHKLKNIFIRSLDELTLCRFGLMEPEFSPEREIQCNSLNLVVVPLLAFDRTGGRLGFGGGYYDSLLSECTCPKIGLGYSFQEVDRIPVEPHDQKLDIIITEKEIIKVNHE